MAVKLSRTVSLSPEGQVWTAAILESYTLVMKIAFILGTSGELIKLYPLIKAAEDQALNWRVFFTGQSGENCLRQWKHFELPDERLIQLLASERDLDSSVQAMRWFFKAVSLKKKFLKSHLNEFDWLIVHGDTLSTLVGAIWAKRTKKPLAHVEAGLRSKHWLSPFPEELSRRWVSKVASLHFAPDSWSKQNLLETKVKGQVVETSGNTMKEALNLILSKAPPVNLPEHEFILANIHRFENLHSMTSWERIKIILKQAAETYPVYLVMHPSTAKKIQQEHGEEFFKRSGVRLMDRMPFHEFAHWLKASKYLITDGGSNQEECSYLGKPCLILRKNSERREGLGENCVLSHFNEKVVTDFLNAPERFSRPPLVVDFKSSKIILDSLVQ